MYGIWIGFALYSTPTPALPQIRYRYFVVRRIIQADLGEGARRAGGGWEGVKQR